MKEGMRTEKGNESREKAELKGNYKVKKMHLLSGTVFGRLEFP